VLACIVITALAGFFKSLGIWNNLTVIGVILVPYFSALLAVLVTPRLLKALPTGLTVIALALALAVPLGLTAVGKQAPDDAIYAQMQATATVAHQLCQTKQQIAVTAFPELFYDCPNATFTLMDSFQELAAAYPRFYKGPTVADLPPKAPILVALSALWMPPAWRSSYTFVRKVDTVRGWGANYFPVEYVVYRLNPAPKAVR
jgi:hypothetical protein